MRWQSDKGELFENFCYLCLKAKIDPLNPVRFWRTKAGAEVDFIVLGVKPVPFEAKAASLKEFKISRSLRSFLSVYQPKTAYCVNLSLSGEHMVYKNTVKFITPRDLINIRV